MDVCTLDGKKSEHHVLCDKEVYIGPKRNNLKQSQWYEKDAKSLKQYREIIEKRGGLEQISNKTLLCFCNFWKKCHGHVLVYLCMKQFEKPIQVYRYRETAACPLSNFFKFDFHFWMHEYRSVTECYYMRKHGAREKELQYAVANVFKMLQKKMEQCVPFREMLLNTVNDSFIIQDSVSTFWGSGNLSSDVCDISGQNIGGWLLMYLLCKDVKELRKKLIFVTHGNVNTKMLQGLKLVVCSLSDCD